MRFADRLKQHRVATRPPVACDGLPRLADRLHAALGLPATRARPSTPTASAPTVSAPTVDPSRGFDVRRAEYALGEPVALPARVSLALPTASRLREAITSVVAGPGPMPGEIAVLDLETTGLGTVGGTAIPAVVGLAFTDGEVVRVRQWVLQRGGAEGHMLDEVAAALEALAARGAIVLTFNGSSFDRPLLTARLRRWGLAPRWPAHVDLLPAARRVWGHAQADCRLPSLEVDRLGVRRVGDIPGAAVADVLARALCRAGPSAPVPVEVELEVEAVVDHNRIDLLSPLCLLPRLHATIRASRPASVQQARGVARQLVALGRDDDARARLDAALASCPSLSDSTAVQAALDCAQLRRRAGDPAGAAALWAWICAQVPGHPMAHERLAKHLEHGRRDPAAALAVASASCEPCPRRLARLRRKAADHAIPALASVVGRWPAVATSAPV